MTRNKSIEPVRSYERNLNGAFFPISHRFRRGLWSAVWLLLASWTPPPFYKWRTLLLRLFGADVAWSAAVYSSVRIWDPKNLHMEKNSCLGQRVNCYSMAPIKLCEGALVSQGAHLCSGTHDIGDENFGLITKPIEIGAYAWVAAEAFIGPGVIVGRRAVLGARSVTFRSLKENTIYVGSPAKEIGKRTKHKSASKDVVR